MFLQQHKLTTYERLNLGPYHKKHENGTIHNKRSAGIVIATGIHCTTLKEQKEHINKAANSVVSFETLMFFHELPN